MFFKENESNKKTMNITLRNFLSFLLYKKEELLNEISKEYSIEERSTFIYNCAINTIVEYMQTHKLYTIPKIASLEKQKLFKENYKINGLAHITGGGFTNLKRLKKNVGYEINDLPEVPEIFKLIYEQNVPLKEMYKVFNMGVGFVVITEEEEADKIMETLKEYCNCQIIGKVIEEDKIVVKTFEGTEVEY